MVRCSYVTDDAAVRSFTLDQLVREHTAGKGYKPAPQWTLCSHCAQPVSTRDSVLIEHDTDGQPLVRHAVCR